MSAVLRRLPGPLRGALSLGWFGANTVLCCAPVFAAAAAKLVLRGPRAQARLARAVEHIAALWVRINRVGLGLLNPVRWRVEGAEGLDPRGSYLVLANHQSWLDVVVLQQVLAGRVPFLKFFIKRQLIWVPALGVAWWALDFPFMRRHSREALARNPRLRGQDLAATRRACARFAGRPTAVMNFVEGTRFTPAKHARQRSPYRHLLLPRAGGAALVLGAMGEQLRGVLDVTIGFPPGGTGFWRFLCGRVPEVRVRVEEIPLDPELVGDYAGDPAHRARFQAWLNDRWAAKDRLLDRWAAASGREEAAPGAAS